ncbi:MAG: cyclodeaminase/cyclohydrolase family protein [Nocardioides sp.]
MYVEQRLSDFLELVADRSPAPGGGAVAAVTASLSANLVTMAARYSADRLTRGDSLVDEVAALGRRAEALADEDAAAYSAVLVARAASDQPAVVGEALLRATEVPLEIAEIAAAIAQLAAEVHREGRADLRGDAATALLLAEGATRAAANLVEINVDAGGGSRDLVSRGRVAIATARAARNLAGRVPVQTH